MPSTLTIQPWPDPVIDTVGFDPRSLYVETFWLPTLGPTALLLLRHLATKFEERTGALELPVAEASVALGVGERDGNSSPIVRSLNRLETFDLACSDGRGTVAVRRNLPPVQRRHLRRLPSDLQSAHAQWAETRPRRGAARGAPGAGRAGSRSRCSRRATTPTTSSACSRRTGFHPAICGDAARWAWQRHRDAEEAAADVRWPTRPRRDGERMPGLQERARRPSPSWIRDARQIVILTGAGISTESGIPDFRGPAGRVDEEPGRGEDRDAPVLRVRSRRAEAGVAQPRRERDVGTPSPNDGHRALAELERKAALHTLVTQNVDGLHHDAGSSAERIIEIHGNVREVKCLTCGWRGADGARPRPGARRRRGSRVPRVRRHPEVGDHLLRREPRPRGPRCAPSGPRRAPTSSSPSARRSPCTQPPRSPRSPCSHGARARDPQRPAHAVRRPRRRRAPRPARRRSSPRW